MKFAAVMLAAFAPALQAPPVPPAPAPDATDTPAPAPPPVEPWQLGIEAGFAEIKDAAAKAQFESAQHVADALLAPTPFLRWKLDFAGRGGWRARMIGAVDPVFDTFGANGLDENARAEVWFAKGVVDSLAKERARAEDAFEKARAGAHDKSLRHDAMYDLGVLALEAGEEARATIPEISGKPQAPPAPPPAAAPGAAPGAPAVEPPDPIQVARAAYLKARDHFVERLKSDWEDADTRANVELCLKRLRQLDEIEKKREEEKKKQEQQKKDQEKKDKDKQDQDKQDKKDKQDKPDQDKKPDADKGDKQDEPKPKDPKDEDPKKDDKKPDADEPKEDENKPDAKKPQPTEQKPGEMSKEEMTQLMDRLAEIEREAQKIQAQLRAARHARVKRDW